MKVAPETKLNSNEKSEEETIDKVNKKVDQLKEKINNIIISLTNSIGDALKKTLTEVKMLVVKIEAISN